MRRWLREPLPSASVAVPRRILRVDDAVDTPTTFIGSAVQHAASALQHASGSTLGRTKK